MDVRDLLEDAAVGAFPRPDGTVTVVREWSQEVAVLGFTAHFVVCAPVDPDWVAAQLPPGDYSAPLGARFVSALADRLGTGIGAHDAVFATVARGGPSALSLEPVDTLAHPRVERARRYRHEVRAWVTPDGAGLVVLGRGVAGRWEVAFEVEPGARQQGLGRRLAAAAPTLLPAGTPVFAQVTPGNAASMRAVQAAGYRPIGGEVLLHRQLGSGADNQDPGRD